MLTDTELRTLFEQLGTPPAGRQKIQWIREHAPVRAVGGGKKSHVVRYASRKMGFAIVCEAKSTEYSAAVTWDFDDETLEFYPQPAFLTFTNRLPDGRASSSTYVPDFLRVTKSGFEFVECKTDEDLLKEARARPHIYSIADDGRWQRPFAEAHVAEFGATFKVRTTQDNNPVLIENLEFLRDYLLAPPHQFDVELQSRMRDLLSERRWCSIATIIDEIPGIADTLYMAIAQGRVVFDITASPISDVARAMVFRDDHCADLYGTFARSQTNEPRREVVLSLTPGAKFDWDGAAWEVINVGHAGIYCRCLASDPEPNLGFITLTHKIVDSLAREGKLSPCGIPQSNASEDEALQRLQRASDDKQLVALERYKCLFEAGYDGHLMTAKKRTRQYWLARFREADASFGIGLLGLLPNWNNTQGNRERKVAKPVVSIMETVIQSDWPDPATAHDHCAIWKDDLDVRGERLASSQSNNISSRDRKAQNKRGHYAALRESNRL